MLRRAANMLMPVSESLDGSPRKGHAGRVGNPRGSFWFAQTLLFAAAVSVCVFFWIGTLSSLPDTQVRPQASLRMGNADLPQTAIIPRPADVPQTAIIPKPAEMVCVLSEAAFVLRPDGVRLFRRGASAEAMSILRELWSRLLGFELVRAGGGGGGGAASDGAVELGEDPQLPPEGYSLQVRAAAGGGTFLAIKVSVKQRRAAVLHALETLRQLLPPEVYGKDPRSCLPAPVPSCNIKDWPRYPWRGLMLDVARHFFDVGQVKNLLSIMSMHKLNVLHLHLSDDQGWRVQVRGKPELTIVGARRGMSLNNPAGDENGERIYHGRQYPEPRFFSVDDIREIVAFASALAIEVVPEIDVPAHAAAMILAARSAGKDIGMVELHEGCAAFLGDLPLSEPPNCMGGTHGIIVPTPEAMKYVLEAISEVADLFPGRYFHLGGDEADQFRDDAYSTEAAVRLMRSLHLELSTQLQGHIVDEVYRLLQSKNKTPIAWDETLFGLEGYRPPPDLLAMWWRDWSSDEAAWAAVLASGYNVILAPTSKMYLDLYQMEPHKDSKFRVQEGTVTLRATYSVAQLEGGDQVLGVHGCLWSEHFVEEEVLEYQLFPRGAAVAEVGWTVKHRASDFDDFLVRWRRHSSRLDRMGVRYYSGSYVGDTPEMHRPEFDGGWFGDS